LGRAIGLLPCRIEKKGAKDFFLSCQPASIALHASFDLSGQCRALREGKFDLGEDGFGVETVDPVAEGRKTGILQKRIVLARISQRDCRTPHRKGANDVVVAAGNNDICFGYLLHEVVQRCGWLECHLVRFRRRKLFQYVARRLHIALVADQQPDLPSAAEKPLCKRGHFGDVIRVNGIPIPAVLFPPAIGHHAEADTLVGTILNFIRNRWQREGDIRADEIPGRGYAEMLHEVVGNLIPVGPEGGKRRGPAKEAPAQRMIDGSGANRDENHACAG